jgi:DNA recombination protein RmuC
MDFATLSIMLLLQAITIITVIWTINRSKSTSNSSDLTADKLQQVITLETTKAQGESLEKLLDRLHQNQQSQQTVLDNHARKQQQDLQNIQLSIQDRLTKSVQSLLETNNKNFELLRKTNEDKLSQINNDVQKRLNENFQENLKSIQQVMQNLGHIQSSAQKMIESTKSIDKLNTIFSRTSSKSFGDFGERYLESLLREHLATGSWDRQVRLGAGLEIIDFTIQIDGKLIGIDAKFPLTRYTDYLEASPENKNSTKRELLNAIKKMGDEISQKYLQTNLLDTLLLYLPSDSLYNEIVNDEVTVTYLQKRKVSLASPSTVYPLIMLIVSYQFKQKVNENAEMIISGLHQVRRNIEGFKEEFRKLGDKIRQAQQNYDSADRNLLGVEKNILMLEDGE